MPRALIALETTYMIEATEAGVVIAAAALRADAENSKPVLIKVERIMKEIRRQTRVVGAFRPFGTDAVRSQAPPCGRDAMGIEKVPEHGSTQGTGT